MAFCGNNDSTGTMPSTSTQPAAAPAQDNNNFWSNMIRQRLAQQSPGMATVMAIGNKPTTTAGMATPKTTATPLADPQASAAKKGLLNSAAESNL